MSARDDFPPEDFDRQVATLRVPPSAPEAEQAVLGALLMGNEAWDRVCDVVSEGDFYRHEHRLAFGAIAALLNARKPADVVSVFQHLQNAGKAGEVSLEYLNALSQGFSGSRAIRQHAELVREKAVLRGLVAASDEIAAAAFNPQGRSVDEILDEAQRKVCAIGEGTALEDDWIGAYEGMLQHSELLERRHSGEVIAWPTGLTDLDDYLEGGLRPGELVIVGARPSMGKTALGLTISLHIAQERPVGFLSMEMSQAEVRDRLTAMLGNVTMSAVKRPARGEGLAWDRVMDGVDKAKRLQLRISDRGGLNINQVRTAARAAKRRGGLDVLVVDYIGLMSGLDAKANRNAQLGEVSRGLKNLAKELQLCVLCLAQLSRKAEERAEGMPQMSDLRDSGEIEQDADVILFIKRPAMAQPDLGPEWQHYARMSVAKNRNGRCGYLDLSYIGEQTRFSGWAGPAPSKASAKAARGMA